MYGWRARIGLLLPMDNAVMEPELYHLGLEGISFHGARLTTTTREEMPQDGVGLARVFNELGADAVVYACAETSFLQGVDGNEWIIGRIREATGLPALTAMSAMLAAIRHLNAGRVGLVSPYTEGRARVMEDFLARSGVEVASSLHQDFSVTTSDSREWLETNRQSPVSAYSMAKTLASSGADAVLISATNFRTFEIIPALEADLGLPVVTCNQAILWAVLRELGLDLQISNLGSLFHSSASGEPK